MVNNFSTIVTIDRNLLSSSIDTWSKTFGLPQGWEEGTGIQQTSDEGYIVVGYTDSQDPYGIWLIKLDRDGNKEWERFLEGDKSGNVEQTSDGGIYYSSN